MLEHRTERDSMGEIKVPADAYYGASTQRAVQNFPISDWRLQRRFIQAMGVIKSTSAATNEELGLLDPKIAKAIREAADEVADGAFDSHFVVDVFQTGSGTSTNMNANEVIANRAIEILGGKIGSKDPVHPNDHVNMCQSSNDVIPTATHMAALMALKDRLLPSLEMLRASLRTKAEEVDDIVKPGRTHLMDATPVRLGQEFAGFASQIDHGLARVAGTFPHLSELALGGTAVGTGINAHPDFATKTIQKISKRLGVPLSEAPDHFEAQAKRDAVVETSGTIKTIAVSLASIASDLRMLASGPRTGYAEITLPSLQPGSSIMPGKVNPVVPEAVIMAAAQVIGNDTAITIGGLGGIGGNFELNTMMPLQAYSLIFSIETTAGSAETLATKCVQGIEANQDRTSELMERTLMTVTALVPLIGYDLSAEVAKQAFTENKSLREVVLERGLLDAAQLDAALNVRKMTEGGMASGD